MYLGLLVAQHAIAHRTQQHNTAHSTCSSSRPHMPARPHRPATHACRYCCGACQHHHFRCICCCRLCCLSPSFPCVRLSPSSPPQTQSGRTPPDYVDPRLPGLADLQLTLVAFAASTQDAAATDASPAAVCPSPPSPPFILSVFATNEKPQSGRTPLDYVDPRLPGLADLLEAGRQLTPSRAPTAAGGTSAGVSGGSAGTPGHPHKSHNHPGSTTKQQHRPHHMGASPHQGHLSSPAGALPGGAFNRGGAAAAAAAAGGGGSGSGGGGGGRTSPSRGARRSSSTYSWDTSPSQVSAAVTGTP
jgi:hypothetical protein